jgi:hypothetical protein
MRHLDVPVTEIERIVSEEYAMAPVYAGGPCVLAAVPSDWDGLSHDELLVDNRLLGNR